MRPGIWLAVEGGFAFGAGGKDQIELAFIPAGPPEYYNSSADCPWPQIRAVKEQCAAHQAFAGREDSDCDRPASEGPVAGYRQVVNMENLYSSKITTVGADFTKGDN